MRNFMAAMQFLTIFPCGEKDEPRQALAASLPWFPLAGLCLGLVLAGVNTVLEYFGCDSLLAGAIVIITLVILTGAIHLDGLADTADALFSGKNREEMLSIMRDPHIGTMGALSLAGMLLLQVSVLQAIGSPSKNTALITMCVLSRWSLVFSMFLFPYARQDGKAKLFLENINAKSVGIATALAIGIAIVVLSIKGILVFCAVAGVSYLINKYIKKRLGGITGDTLGAINEVSELVAIFSVYALEIIWP
ncbi:MAG: adenosylcobinamide-GDP ribazoletransferase [Candidatus Omnitrophica bacterium]|nr:adenosylcobinamide-GDP ribazoletransferase [Candidatus Omnitrophota bacterium]MCM8791363.1 adenosylcobinamide-GDP ribazoletransferase [Candidatus Omnitrophota bacterium]